MITRGMATLSFGPFSKMLLMRRWSGAKEPSASSPSSAGIGERKEDSGGSRSSISIGVAEGYDSRIDASSALDRSLGDMVEGFTEDVVGALASLYKLSFWRSEVGLRRAPWLS